MKLNNIPGILPLAATSCFFATACIVQDSAQPDNSSSSAESSSSSGISSSSPAIDYASSAFVPDASWDCGAPEGIPPPTEGELVFSATVQLGDIHNFGETPYGKRKLLDVESASLNGPEIRGEFLSGGLELELELPTGSTEIEQINILRADNNTHILMRTCGFSPEGTEQGRFIPDFEAPSSSPYAWLNTGEYAGLRTVNESEGTIELEVYDISGVAVTQPRIEISDPTGIPNQPWNCLTLSGSRGATVLTENVTLGGSINIGASKYGSRNIIPITGGEFSGRLAGSILPGGADYQLSGNGGGTILDARYTLRTDDGEYILVRNCGPFGGLVPMFETRKDGPYAFLNKNEFLSSDPGLGNGGVSISFYEID